jgi:hypothetical protein
MRVRRRRSLPGSGAASATRLRPPYVWRNCAFAIRYSLFTRGAPRWTLALVGRAGPEKSYTVEHGERKTRFQQPRVVSFGRGRACNRNRNRNLNLNPTWLANVQRGSWRRGCAMEVGAGHARGGGEGPMNQRRSVTVQGKTRRPTQNRHWLGLWCSALEDGARHSHAAAKRLAALPRTETSLGCGAVWAGRAATSTATTGYSFRCRM